MIDDLYTKGLSMAVFQLEEENIFFPKPELANPDGLLAVGGDLRLERLLLAYSNGIFPWYNEGEPILWWCPKERFIIYPSKIHVSRSMDKFLRHHSVTYTINRDFAYTMHECRVLRESTGTWINDDMEEAYLNLHKAGFALSFEAYFDDQLAGGLYGVAFNRCFFGESMYSVLPNGSKAALIGLAGLLSDNDFKMIDCQFHTKHLESMGGIYISYAEYMDLISDAK